MTMGCRLDSGSSIVMFRLSSILGNAMLMEMMGAHLEFEPTFDHLALPALSRQSQAFTAGSLV